MKKFIFEFSVLLGMVSIFLAAAIFISPSSSFSSHGTPLNWIEGIHDEGVALSGTERPVLLGGDDGTNLVNVLVDSGGRFQVDLVAGVVDLGADNDVVLTAGSLYADSPTVEVAVLSLFDGSAETQIADTNLGASKAITISGSGRITKVCIVSSLGSILAQDGAVLFFDADPAIAADAADLTLAEAQTVVAVVDFVAADYLTSFASSAVACNVVDEPFHSISHVVYHSLGATLLDDEDLELHLWYRRDS